MFHLLVLLIEQSRLSNGQHKQCSCRQENFQRRWDGRGLCSDCLLCGAEEVVSDSFRFVVTRRRTANEDSDRWSQKSFQSVFELRHYDQNFIGFVLRDRGLRHRRGQRQQAPCDNCPHWGIWSGKIFTCQRSAREKQNVCRLQQRVFSR